MATRKLRHSNKPWPRLRIYCKWWFTYDTLDNLSRAPELLRSDEDIAGTQEGDVYSFAVVVQEIYYKKGPFYTGEDDRQSDKGKFHIDKL